MTRRPCAAALLIALLGAAGCAAGSSAGETHTADAATATGQTTTMVDDTSTTPAGVQPDGFSTVTARITAADGTVCEVCMWLADSDDERGRGLMGVTDLGDAVAMAFQFDRPTNTAFYMFQTPTPLSIAWFDPAGAFVGSADMAPCVDRSAGDCPLYSPDADYDLGVEVFDGGLDPLGLGPGSRVELLAGSEAEHCALTEP